jgi:hypothetical protein
MELVTIDMYDRQWPLNMPHWKVQMKDILVLKETPDISRTLTLRAGLTSRRLAIPPPIPDALDLTQSVKTTRHLRK